VAIKRVKPDDWALLGLIRRAGINRL